MPHPKDLLIADFSYELPEDKIASHPLATRDASKVLVYDKGAISETVFGTITDHLPPDSLLVFNNSKVIQSRLSFTKPTGGGIEIFILEPCGEYGDISGAMKTEGSIRCNCLVGGAKKWKAGKLEMQLDGNVEPVVLRAEMIEKKSESYIIEFNWHPEVDFATALELFGNTPIPPYLNRPADESDKERYQTIYAKEDGSVAAPTAGLHFTPTVMQSLQVKNIQTAFVTLHVGAGTFKPVKSERISGHEIHAEFIDVVPALIEQLIVYPAVIPVGTTSMRTIESLYWMGVKAHLDMAPDLAALEIKQWEVYDSLASHSITKQVALSALQQWMKTRQMSRLILRTQILIAPPYQAKIATSLITNFHQPQSTLLLLIAALAGDDWKKMYRYALYNDFRFLSYGDSCLIKW
ncbi:MAG: S-adenosylmethionine:tRNA ribosyltransferase-isomerase [Chitinophagaceae bacterium]